MAVNKNIIDTGLVEFELPFDRGTEKIYFNPNDVDFFIRLTDMITSISKLYDGLTEQYEKTQDNFEKLEIIRELNNKVKDAFDVAFGNNVSDAIFKYVSPHGIISSRKQHYSFYILEYLMPLIEKETGRAAAATTAALEKAMNKHTVRYQHKFGR